MTIGSSGIFQLPNPQGTGDFSLTAAGTYTGEAATGFAGIHSLSLQVAFGYGSGGGAGTWYFQTSLDQGNTWIDLAAKAFTTSSDVSVWNFETNASVGPIAPGDGAMSGGSKQDGILGDRFRLKVVTTSTAYVGTTLAGRISAR